ncbi:MULTISPECIES: S24 family peptidase [Gammaproteobacteria]|uniref:S24 family peptidase n=1 Tax=Pantoea sp. BJFS-204 TaxID=3404823 RepID=UPI003BB6DB36
MPTPTADYVKSERDLTELCIRRRASTFFVRASSMQELGLFDGDVMAVYRADEASHGDIVIAEVNGEFTLSACNFIPALLSCRRIRHTPSFIRRSCGC